MFLPKNLLFLVFLAFVSWVILCYLNKMDGAQDFPIRVDSKKVLNVSEKTMESIISAKKASSHQHTYTTYINFLWIFSCIYVLAKIISLSERSVNDAVSPLEVSSEAGGDTEFNMIFSMRHEIKRLRKRNAYWEARMRDLQQYNLLLMGQNLPQAHDLELRPDGSGGYILIACRDGDAISEEMSLDGSGVASECCANESDDGIDDESTVTANLSDDQLVRLIAAGQLPYSCQQNVFIANRLVHLNRQVYVNEGNVKLTIANGEGSDFVQIWEKYLGMRQHQRSFPETTPTETTTTATTTSPSSPDSDGTTSQVRLDSKTRRQSEPNIEVKTTNKSETLTTAAKMKTNLSDATNSTAKVGHAGSRKGSARKQRKRSKIVFVSTEELESMKGKYI